MEVYPSSQNTLTVGGQSIFWDTKYIYLSRYREEQKLAFHIEEYRRGKGQEGKRVPFISFVALPV